MTNSQQKLSFRQRFNFSRFAISHKLTIISAWLGIIIAGLLAFNSLSYSLFPNISFPVVVVTAKSPINSSVATETQLTQTLEKPLQSLSELDELYSVTYPGQSVINVLFNGGTDLDAVTAEVKAIINQTTLPTATTTQVIPVDLNESSAITYVLLSQEKTKQELYNIAQQEIFPRITQLPGVRKLNILGIEEKTENSLGTRISFNGQETLGFQVIKRHEANTLEVVKEVQTTVAAIQTNLPDIQLTIAETQADYIEAAVTATIQELIMAIIIAVVVIFFFLRNWRATLITALGIPISLSGTFLVMAIFHVNLQTLTLLALALVIGIVIDDSIVDVENIVRLINRGKTPKQAAIEGTDEISLAVTASTLTIAAVFIPVAFMGGTVGKFFKPFGLTISAAVIFSLLVARTLAPSLAVLWLKPQVKNNQTSVEKESFLVTYYKKALQWSLNHRQIVMAIALGSVILGVSIIPLIPQGFIPRLDRGEFNVNYTVALPNITLNPSENAPENLPENSELSWLGNLSKSPERFLLRKTLKVGQELETEILQHPDVKSVLTIAGNRGQPNRGKLAIQLKSDRENTTAIVQSQVRDRLPEINYVSTSVEDIPFVETEAEKPLQIAIVGEDLELLNSTVQKIKAEAIQITGLVDLELSYETDKIERLNGERVIYLSANLESDVALEDVTAKLEAKAIPLIPEGISWRRWGNSDHSSQVIGRFTRTFLLSVVLMLTILVLLFGRIREPIVVILCLPLSLSGAMLGLLITGSDFGIISLIGFIFLVGLLDKNALLLMDYANQLRMGGMKREQALIETGAVRLRPILMTTTSTILGMLPIALGWGAGAELRQPMAVAIMGGLFTSSLLSLFVVPVLYSILEDMWGS